MICAVLTNGFSKEELVSWGSARNAADIKRIVGNSIEELKEGDIEGAVFMLDFGNDLAETFIKNLIYNEKYTGEQDLADYCNNLQNYTDNCVWYFDPSSQSESEIYNGAIDLFNELNRRPIK